MSVIAGCTCDKCNSMIYWPHVSKYLVIKWARNNGWSIGKQTLCQKCRAKKKENRNDEG